MSTATIAAPLNGAGSANAAQDIFGQAVHAKAAGTSAVMAARIRNLYAGGTSRLAALAERLHLTGAWRWLQSHVGPRLTWARSIIARIGVIPLIGYTITTRWGMNLIFNTVPRFVMNRVVGLLRFASFPVRWPLSKFEAGRKINAKVGRAVTWVEIGFCAVLDNVHVWMGDRHDTLVMRWIRGAFALVLFVRVLALFTSSTPLIVAGTIALAVFVPISTREVFDTENRVNGRTPVVDELDGIVFTIVQTVQALRGRLSAKQSMMNDPIAQAEAALAKAEETLIEAQELDEVNGALQVVAQATGKLDEVPMSRAGAAALARKERRDDDRVAARAAKPGGQNRQHRSNTRGR